MLCLQCQAAISAVQVTSFADICSVDAASVVELESGLVGQDIHGNTVGRLVQGGSLRKCFTGFVQYKIDVVASSAELHHVISVFAGTLAYLMWCTEIGWSTFYGDYFTGSANDGPVIRNGVLL